MSFLDSVGLSQLWSKIVVALNKKVNKKDFESFKSNLKTDDNEIIELFIQEDVLPVVTDADDSILVDEDENILLW